VDLEVLKTHVLTSPCIQEEASCDLQFPSFSQVHEASIILLKRAKLIITGLQPGQVESLLKCINKPDHKKVTLMFVPVDSRCNFIIIKHPICESLFVSNVSSRKVEAKNLSATSVDFGVGHPKDLSAGPNSRTSA
jgi:hypothetical protein